MHQEPRREKGLLRTTGTRPFSTRAVAAWMFLGGATLGLRISVMIRILVTTLASLTALGVAQPCNAQIVRIGGLGGVSVRAPFVSVDVGPFGGTRVRAPFTSVYSYGGPVVAYPRPFIGLPAYRPLPAFGVVPVVPAYPAVAAYRVPVFPVPVVEPMVQVEAAIPVQGYQVTRPSTDGNVAEDLRRAAIRLQYSLSLRHDGDVWLDYLNPALIIASVESGSATPSLAALISNYDGVVANGSLRPIYTASGFNETRELLRVYVDMQPAQRPVPAPPVAAAKASPTQGEQQADSLDPLANAEEELPAPKPAAKERDNKVPVPPPPAPIPPREASEKKAPEEPTEV